MISEIENIKIYYRRLVSDYLSINLSNLYISKGLYY